MSIITSTVQTDSFSAGYLKFGSGKRNLIILPGLSVQSVLPYAGSIEKHYEVFSEKFTVYLLERRNELPPEYTINDMAADTAAVMNALDIEKADVFGASQGGMIALTMAADHPSLVHKTAVASTSARIDRVHTPVLSEWIDLARIRNREGLYLSFGEKINPPEVFNTNKEAYIALSETITDGELDRFITLAEGTYGFDITGRAGDIKCPVFCVFDTSDAVLGTDAGYGFTELFSGKNNFEYFAYSGFGHALYDTAPDFAQKLYDFFIK